VIARLHGLEPAIWHVGTQKSARGVGRQIPVARRLDHGDGDAGKTAQIRVRRGLAGDELLLLGQRHGDDAGERRAETALTSRDDREAGAA